jgi:radical SAM superfamily enzyme YgiQ (UPF0313 family)
VKWRDIENARRILARERGYTLTDWGGRLPIALAYANTYRLGMSNLALHTLYRLFNLQPHVVCERVFWSPRSSDPVMTLEGQRDVMDAAVLAVSLSFELDYINLVGMLKRARIPLLSAERDETYPLVLAGGPAVSANPQPPAEICDAFVIGEAEEIVGPLTDLLWEMIDAPRDELLNALAGLDGVYVPGRSALPVRRLAVLDLDAYPTHTVIQTPDTEFGDMFLMEVSRGCARGCRFCLAGQIYRPLRERSLDNLLGQAESARREHDRIGLVGAAISDYSRISDLVRGLREMDLRISVSSLRVDPLPHDLIAALAASSVRTLTIAPEAGCERLRQAVRKGVTEPQVLAAVDLAQAHRFPALKLYFMIGLPGETRDDVQAIADLTRDAAARFSGEIAINATPFVPKAHTPLQWAAMDSTESLEQKTELLQEALRPDRVQVRAEGAEWARVQGVLARGDARVGRALVEMAGRTSLRAWRKALQRAGLNEGEYLSARTPGDPLPWHVVDSGATAAHLLRERDRAQAALDLSN